MSQNNRVHLIPKGYRRQSEVLDWLPCSASIQDDYGKSLTKKIHQSSRKRESKMVNHIFLGTFFFFVGVASFISTPRGNENIAFGVSLLFIVIALSFMMIGAWLLRKALHEGLWSKKEPHLRSLYKGNRPEEFSKVCDYWDKFLQSEYQIYASVGNNGLGVPLNYKMKEYGYLSLMGNKKQRGAIFTPLMKHIMNEWWFPDPEMLNLDNDKTEIQLTMIEQIIFHENDNEAKDFLIRLSAIIDKEPTKKSLIARRRWVEIISITRANRHIKNNQKREAAVRLEMIEKGIELKPPSPLEEISKYYTYRDAEKAIQIYLDDQHLLMNNLAKNLRTQLTQLRQL